MRRRPQLGDKRDEALAQSATCIGRQTQGNLVRNHSVVVAALFYDGLQVLWTDAQAIAGYQSMPGHVTHGAPPHTPQLCVALLSRAIIVHTDLLLLAHMPWFHAAGMISNKLPIVHSDDTHPVPSCVRLVIGLHFAEQVRQWFGFQCGAWPENHESSQMWSDENQAGLDMWEISHTPIGPSP